MPRSCAVLMLLLTASNVLSQEEGHGPEPDWTEQLVGGKLVGWQIDGDSVADKDSITIGGKTQTKVRLVTPVGDRFGLRLEFQFTGTAPALQLQTNQLTTWNLGGPGPNRWMEFRASGTQGSWRRGSVWQQTTRALDGSYHGSGGLFVGAGPLREFNIVVPPNSKLTIRRLAFHTTPVTERSPYGLILAIVVLVALLVGIMALGWFVNRRRSVVAPRPTVSE